MDLSINDGTLVVTGGPGDTTQTAIVITKTPKGLSAAGAEQMLLQKWFGRQGTDWTRQQQDLLQQNGRTYDVYRVTLVDGSERMLYFDVTEWLGACSSNSMGRAHGACEVRSRREKEAMRDIADAEQR